MSRIQPKFRIVGEESSSEVEPEDGLTAPASAGGTGGGGSSGGMDGRVAALEGQMARIDDKLGAISQAIAEGRLDNERRFGALDTRLATIEAVLEGKSDRAALATAGGDLGTRIAAVDGRITGLDGRVSNIPTFWQVFFLMLGAIAATLGGVAGLAFTLSKIVKP